MAWGAAGAGGPTSALRGKGGSMEVQAECPWCGMVTLRPTEVRCEADPRSDEALCEINCPVCHRLVYAKTTADGIKIIRAAGASGISGLVPFELLERRSGPPLLWDEVLDMLGVALNVNRGPNRGASSDASSTIT